MARTLEEGLRHLLATPALAEIFGELFLRAYSAVKLDEFEGYVVKEIKPSSVVLARGQVVVTHRIGR